VPLPLVSLLRSTAAAAAASRRATALQLQPLCCCLLLQLLLLLLEQGQLLLQQVPGRLWQRKLEVPRLGWVEVGPAINSNTPSCSSSHPL
jgi:hypothetical protein